MVQSTYNVFHGPVDPKLGVFCRATCDCRLSLVMCDMPCVLFLVCVLGVLCVVLRDFLRFLCVLLSACGFCAFPACLCDRFTLFWSCFCASCVWFCTWSCVISCNSCMYV